jgi:hypothetical protein
MVVMRVESWLSTAGIRIPWIGTLRGPAAAATTSQAREADAACG